jgi:hypothetical protein
VALQHLAVHPVGNLRLQRLQRLQLHGTWVLGAGFSSKDEGFCSCMAGTGPMQPAGYPTMLPTLMDLSMRAMASARG